MKLTKIILCTVMGTASVAAYSQEKNTIRIGVADITIHSQAPSMTSNGPAFLTPQPADIKVGDATTLLISYIRKLNEHWDFDMELGWPPSHETRGQGALASVGVLSNVKQANPTFLFNYNFGTAHDKFRPYVGIGINYTHFFDAKSTAAADLASGGPTKISLTDSVGLAVQVGASYKLAEHWSVIGGIGTAKVKADLTATTGSIERKTTIDYRPVVYTLGIGYSF